MTDPIFQSLVSSVDIMWLIRHRMAEDGREVECPEGQGYLVPPVLRHLLIDGLDLSQVPTSRRSGTVDFREHELAEAMEEAGAFEIVAKTVVSELSGRRGVLFAPTVASSKHLAQVMTDLGVPCGHVDGAMDGRSRDQVIQDFRENKISWLSNVGIVSEGFDLPEIDTVVLARPTRSRIFWRQAIGRSLRPAAGKDHAVILDVSGASDGHTLAGVAALTDADVVTARDGESLTELFDRSNRERAAVVDQISAHRERVAEIQDRGKRGVEQITLTERILPPDQVPGVGSFAERARALHEQLAETCREAKRARTHGKTLDELRAIELAVADHVTAAGRVLSHLDQLKVVLRSALMALQEQPAGEVARAMITGHVGTVAGQLFGEGESRSVPKKPGDAQALQVTGGRKGPKASFSARFGWSLRTHSGHLFLPVHGHGGNDDITGLAVVVRLDASGMNCLPVTWSAKTQNVEEIDIVRFGTTTLSEDRAYKVASGAAAEASHAPNMIDPNAPWRRKPASERAVAAAWRIAGKALRDTGGLPEDATAGLVADVITYARFHKTVERLGEHVIVEFARRDPRQLVR